jgi:hypothetical protein
VKRPEFGGIRGLGLSKPRTRRGEERRGEERRGEERRGEERRGEAIATCERES